jgi:hypothetical protein
VKLTFGTALLVLIFGLTGMSATAQADRVNRYYDYDYAHIHRYHHVRGPAYGWSGEPLGPVYMHTTGPEKTPDPRTCGPGACQNNPLY